MPIYKVANEKKNGLQKYRVRVSYIDTTGKYKQIERIAYGKAEATDMESKLQYELAHKTGTNKITVQSLFEEYIKVKAYEVRETTLKKSTSSLKAYVLPYLANTNIDKLTGATLQEWKNKINEKNFAFSMKKGIYSEFRAMLNYAVRMEYLPKNPINTVGNFKDAYETNTKEKLHYYTPEQFKKYIAVAREHAMKNNSLNDWGYYVFFMIAYYT